MATVTFSLLDGAWAVVRLPPDEAVPAWALGGAGLVSVTRTAAELSLVCPEAAVPAGVRAERGWAVLALHGPFAFDEVGVLAGVAGPLAAAGVSIFALSTFDTDYMLVKATAAALACRTLLAAGHRQAG